MKLTRSNAAVLIFLLSVAVYASSLFNYFAYDDVAVIRDDVRVHSMANMPQIFATSYWNNQAQALYRPLVTASFAADWAVASNHPGWFHFINVLWNAITCVLILLVLAELFPLPAALAGALIFAVHPVHVEAVANVVGRAEMMAAAFGMGAALLWLRSGRDEIERSTMFFTIPALFFLALLCKESAIMLPPLLVLLDLAHGRLHKGNAAQWLKTRFLSFAALAIAGIVYIILRASVLHTFGPSNLDAALEVAPRGLPRVFTALQVWPAYLRLFVFPRVLLADYGPRIFLPLFSVTPGVVAGFAILFTCIIGGCVAAARGYGRTALALLWAPIAMLPVSNLLFPIGILVAERTLYLPIFALSVAASSVVEYAGSTRGCEQMQKCTQAYATKFDATALVWTVILVICAAFTARTELRIPEWKSTQSIFRALLKSRPDSFRAHWHLARKAADAKNPTSALMSYSKSMQLWPYRTRLLKEAGDYAVQHGELPFARQVAEQGVRAWPRDPDFRRSLAGIALDLGDTATAVKQIDEGLRLLPRDSILRAMQTAVAHPKGKE